MKREGKCLDKVLQISVLIVNQTFFVNVGLNHGHSDNSKMIRIDKLGLEKRRSTENMTEEKATMSVGIGS